MGVPLLISGPGLPAGVVRTHPISLLDLFPTICALCELSIPDGLDGVDFSAALRDPAIPSPRTYAPSAAYRYGVRINYNSTPDDMPWRPGAAFATSGGTTSTSKEASRCCSTCFRIRWRRRISPAIRSTRSAVHECAKSFSSGFSWEGVTRSSGRPRQAPPVPVRTPAERPEPVHAP